MKEENKKTSVSGNKGKKKSNKRPGKKNASVSAIITPLAKIILIVAVILILLFIAADRFGNISFSSVGDYFGGLVSGMENGGGYPYYFESNTPENVMKIGNDFLVVEKDKVFVLDSTAKKILESEHAYAVPLAQSKNSRAVIFDAGGDSYKVVSKTKVLYEKKLDSRIITASLGKDGSVALGVRGTSAMSRLLVFNKNQKTVFDWQCAKENIISTAVSDNGKYAAVSIVGAENGELYSKVLFFDFDYSEPLYEYDFGEKIVSRVSFVNGGKIMASGEKVLSFIKGEKNKDDIDLSLNTLSRIYTNDDNTTIVALSKYGSSSVKILKGYSKNGKELFSTEINSNVRSVSCSGGYISVLTDRQLLCYNKRGKNVGSSDVPNDGISCFNSGSSTYVFTTGALEKYKSFGNNEKPKSTEKTQTEKTKAEK